MNQPILRSYLRRATGAALLAFCASLTTFARADLAVVVGVQQYPKLGADGNKLKGCVSDARTMAAVLTKRGFAVTLLTDKQATKAGILDALDAARKAAKPGEEFVFYFAGHGTNRPAEGLLPSDIAMSGGVKGFKDGLLKKDEVYNAVRNVPAAHRTVILDACFSGGLLHAATNVNSRVGEGRFFDATDAFRRAGTPIPAQVPLSEISRADANADSGDGTLPVPPKPTGRMIGRMRLDNERASGQDAPTPTPGATPQTIAAPAVDYVTATKDNQKAFEIVDKGASHGMFTYFLAPKIADTQAKKPWGTVITEVKAAVDKELPDFQTPTLSPSLQNVLPLAAPAVASAPGTPAAPTNTTPLTAPQFVWDMFVDDRPDPTALRLLIPNAEENKTHQSVGDTVTMRVTADSDGILVILGRDAKNLVYVLFPDGKFGNTIDRAQVIKGKGLNFPAKFLDPGVETYKAVLFKNKADAEALLKTIGDGMSGNNARRTVITGAAMGDGSFITSSFFVEVEK